MSGVHDVWCKRCLVASHIIVASSYFIFMFYYIISHLIVPLVIIHILLLHFSFFLLFYFDLLAFGPPCRLVFLMAINGASRSLSNI